jgi:NAD(P)-dependent dehydrogenase (short-subunit alcohol dehydrogenase family)
MEPTANQQRETRENPTEKYPKDFPKQEQSMPASEQRMNPKPDHGEETYKGTGKLAGKKALITGADSGIGKAVAIAFAREGADVPISYLNEDADAKETAQLVEKAGRKAILIPGDISNEEHCRSLIDRAVKELGGLDILVNNAAYQMSHKSLEEISSKEFDYTFKTNVYAMFWLCKYAEPHLKPGAAVINTSSVNAYTPSKELMPYAVTKGAIQNFTALLAQMWGEKGVRVNCVAPGPIWTPLIVGSFPAEKMEEFGKKTPLKRAGQPAELAPVYVLLASNDGSYMNGATVQVTGGMPTV